MKPPRIAMSSLSAGLRDVLTTYENAVKAYARLMEEIDYERLMDPQKPISPAETFVVEKAFKHYDHAKQTLLRKLTRMASGPNEGSVEQMKRDFRRLAKAYIAVAGHAEAKQLFPNEWKIADTVSRGTRAL